MKGERRVAVSGSATVRARTMPGDAPPPPGTRPADRPARAEPPGTEPPDSDPLYTGPGEDGPAEASALIRAQLRIALGTFTIVMAVVAGLPALLALVPAIARARIGGVPLWWLVLALGIQPVWVAVSLLQLRRAERAERDLARPVDRP